MRMCKTNIWEYSLRFAVAVLSVLAFTVEPILSREADLDDSGQPPGILTIHVDHEIIQRAAELASPIRLKGVQKTAFGGVPWNANITNPRIQLTESSATFVADALIEARPTAGPIKVPVQIRQKVTGELEPHYLEKKNRIIIKPVNVVLKSAPNKAAVQGFGNLDLNGMIPDIEIPVYLPRPYFKVDKKTIKVSIDPTFEFDPKGLRITTPVKFAGPRKK